MIEGTSARCTNSKQSRMCRDKACLVSACRRCISSPISNRCICVETQGLRLCFNDNINIRRTACVSVLSDTANFIIWTHVVSLYGFAGQINRIAQQIFYWITPHQNSLKRYPPKVHLQHDVVHLRYFDETTATCRKTGRES